MIFETTTTSDASGAGPKSLCATRCYGAALSLACLALSGCVDSSHQEGIHVDLALFHTAWRAGTTSESPQMRRFTTSSGAEVELSAALMTVSSVELMPCGAPPARVSAQLRHGVGGPTTLATPWVDSMLRPDDEPMHIGTLLPPPGDYCMARVQLAPADADALGHADHNMVGLSARVEGVFTAPGAEPLSFSLSTSGVRLVDLPLGDGVRLDLDTPWLDLGLGTYYDSWLDTLSSPTQADAPDALMGAVAASMTLEQWQD